VTAKRPSSHARKRGWPTALALREAVAIAQPLGVPIFEQLDLGASGPIEPAHQLLDRREQKLRQCNHPASPGLSLRGREAFLHVNRAKELSLVGGETYRLLRGTDVSLEKQLCGLPAALQIITRGQERPPIAHEYRVMKRSLEPAPPRMATTKLVDLGIPALERQRLGRPER